MGKTCERDRGREEDGVGREEQRERDRQSEREGEIRAKKNKDGGKSKEAGCQARIRRHTSGSHTMWQMEPHASERSLRKAARGPLDGNALVWHVRGRLGLVQVYSHRATLLLWLLLKGTLRVTVDNILLDFLVTMQKHPPV